MTVPDVPVKTREFQNHHMDSTIWNNFPFRDDDIVISTHSKSGTTWMQQIVSQLIHRGDGSVPPNLVSPWVEMRIIRDQVLGLLESQTQRRFMKTHLPRDAMVWNPKVKYIFVARDGRDMIWSAYNHFTSATPLFWQLINDTPGRVGPPMQHPPEDPRDLFLDYVEDDTRPTVCWPFWSHMRGWWAVKDQPNVLLVHFADLKRDMEGEMKRIAEFLDISNLSDDEWKAAVEHCTFDWMKEHADQYAPPQSDVAFEGGAKSFINKGTNGRWKDVLTEEDNARYRAKAEAELGEECAKWLENGRLA